MTKPGFQIVKRPAEVAPIAPDAMLIEPWFRTRQETVALKRLQTFAERQKFADFYEIFGCLRCATKNRPHAGEGLCDGCHSWFGKQLQRAMKARQRGEIGDSLP